MGNREPNKLEFAVTRLKFPVASLLLARRLLFNAAMLLFIKSNCFTFIAHNLLIRVQKSNYHTAGGYRNLLRAFKHEAGTMFNGKILCRASLTAGSPSCRSNVNCKLTRPQDCGHVTLPCLRFA